MSWITASIGLNDNQTQIKCIDVNRISVRGGHSYCILITVGY